MICHAGRDLCTGLLELRDVTKRPRADTNSVLQEIEPEWAKGGFDAIDTAVRVDPASLLQATVYDDVTISRHLVKLLQRLMEEHRLGSINQEEQAVEMFVGSNPEAAKRPELLRPVSREWVKLRRWFQQYAHFGVHQTTPAEKELHSQFAILENYVLGIKRTFYEGMEGLDEILGEANS